LQAARNTLRRMVVAGCVEKNSLELDDVCASFVN
jgi:hypothetical protein